MDWDREATPDEAATLDKVKFLARKHVWAAAVFCSDCKAARSIEEAAACPADHRITFFVVGAGGGPGAGKLRIYGMPSKPGTMAGDLPFAEIVKSDARAFAAITFEKYEAEARR